MTITRVRWLFAAACILVFLAKMWLVQAHSVLATPTPHDDLLFIRQAHAILSGEWLGDYSQYTLIKGQFYPLFIALSYWLCIPLLAAQQILYALTCLVFLLAVRPVLNNRALLFLVFVFLLLNPFTYNYPAVGRIFRLGIYPTLGLLVFSCLTGMFLRSRHSLKQALPWSLGMGLALAAFWHTREESIWIVPSLSLVFVYALWNGRTWGWRYLGGLVLLFLLPMVILAASTWTLSLLNEHYYGVKAPIEIETPEFKSAYGGLLRIRSEHWRQFYPVVKDVREKAYAVSPAFREIKPYLDGPVGKKWMDFIHGTDLPAAFFIWVFRDSVAEAGYYKDGRRTLDFYRRMGAEIDQACADGRLDCRMRITSLVPTWHREYNRLFFPTFFSVFNRIIHFSGFSAKTDGLLSRGTMGIMRLYSTVTREKVVTSRKDVLQATPEYYRHLNREKTRILQDIGGGYQKLVPALFWLALAVLLVILVQSLRKRELCFFTVLALATLAGIAAITFILTLVAITSYSEIERAMHTAFPLVLLFILAVFIDLWSRLFPGQTETTHGWSAAEC